MKRPRYQWYFVDKNEELHFAKSSLHHEDQLSAFKNEQLTGKVAYYRKCFFLPSYASLATWRFFGEMVFLLGSDAFWQSGVFFAKCRLFGQVIFRQHFQELKKENGHRVEKKLWRSDASMANWRELEIKDCLQAVFRSDTEIFEISSSSSKWYT